MEAAAALNPGWRMSSYSSNGGSTCVEVGATQWRKSTYSGNGGSSCVEAGHVPGAVLIRDTTQRGQGPVLRVSARTWRQFTAAIREAGLVSRA